MSVLFAQPLEIRFAQPPNAKDSAKSEAFFGTAAAFPSSNWESQAQPLGNGRLGVMVFGNPLKERVQFNEGSLWTGGTNPSGGYDVNEFGAYQNFGDLFIEMGSANALTPSAPVCTSGQIPSPGQDVSNATDGDPRTKWCLEHQNKSVVWQVDLGKPQVIHGYSFTSAEDMPARDPRTWKFEGSADGQTWRLLDQHKDEKPYTKRGETKSYAYPTDKTFSFRYYRFVFAPATDNNHFQVAEIALTGLKLADRPPSNIQNYSRTLDLATATHLTTWKQDGVTFKREVFVSYPDQVIVIRITAEQPGKVSGSVRLADAHQSKSPDAAKNAITFAGSLSNNLRYAACVQVQCDGGKPAVSGERIAFSGNSATIILTAATDYALDPAKKFRSGIDPAITIAKQTATAAAKSYDDLRSSHVADFRKLMGRVDLDVGPPPQGKAIPERLEDYKKGAHDPHLEALMFQYGRYLFISSSRGFLPANLQGLWNESNKPPWFADYHTNINIQMNYWLAEPANLSECALPLINWTEAMIPGSREATVKDFGDKIPGWTMRTSVNIFGGNGWQWNLPASAWLAQHFWEHYAFAGNKEYLAKTAWPVLSAVSEYWLGHLVEKNAKLVIPNGWSPEHGPREDGVAHDQQIVWDLFTNTLDAAKELGKNDPLVTRIFAAREKLLGPQVGSWGQIMEWTTERPDLEKSGHRHTSHLFALYPGRQILLSATPDLAKAAAVSLESRGTSGDSQRSWTWPWRAAMWARLGRGDKAGEMIRGLLTHNTYPNLFTTHPPFQIDGNLGITGGLCETLVQSHAGEISILPALPTDWKDGNVRGLSARGGFEVDVTWKDGRFTQAKLHSVLGNPAVLRVPGNPPAIILSESGDRSAKVPASKDGTFRFPTQPGKTYLIIEGR
ncbi:MAG: glycoside hydrolase N-terminal domain-containing protein [Verrucomicrobiota bacterium]